MSWTQLAAAVRCSSLKQLPQDAKALEEEIVNQSGRDFYGGYLPLTSNSGCSSAKGNIQEAMARDWLDFFLPYED